jgi:UDPglucose 6-dehydrogenase
MYKKITVIGCGYVGTSMGILFSQKYHVHFVDINLSRVELLSNNKSPVDDAMISNFLNTKKLNFSVTTSLKDGLQSTDLVIVALPTNFDNKKKAFNTALIEDTVALITQNQPNIPIVIKSTVPVGFTKRIIHTQNNRNIIFCPEFLTEGKALEDNLYPSRIILGGEIDMTKKIGKLLKSLALNSPPVLFMTTCEAEAVKLFSNTYLALRIAYFNELDSFSLANNLSSESIINGMAHDRRIGNHYNNPSFGYGGYCLPKDTKQLHASFDEIPNNLTAAIVKSNHTRKKFIAEYIHSLGLDNVGIYRLNMKAGSDNYRNSAILDVMRYLKKHQNNLFIYEPLITSKLFLGIPVLNNLHDFKEKADMILANRITKELDDVASKIFSRDLFHIN